MERPDTADSFDEYESKPPPPPSRRQDSSSSASRHRQPHFLIDIKVRSAKRNAFVKTESKLDSMLNKELFYLKNNTNLLNESEKNEEIAKYLKEKERHVNPTVHQRSVVKTKLSANRNPNVESLLQDVRSEDLSLNKLQENLKNEFSSFIDRSVNNSIQKIKNVKSPSVTDDIGETRDEGKKFFLTENYDPDERLNESRLIKSSRPQTLSTAKNSEPKATADANQMQLALVDDDHDENASENKQSLIKLKKMIDDIKRVDLPKFQTELHQVCQYGNDPDLLKFYQESEGYSLEKKQNDLGRYCVHECCIKGNVNMLRGLLKYVDDINKVDKNGQNAAHIAAKYGELECLKLLAANKIDLRHKDNCGMEPTHLAAIHNHARVVEFLFDMGVPLNKPCASGKLPLHYACEHGSLDVIKKLSEYFIDMSVPDKNGNTGVHLAAQNDRLSCLKVLANLNVPINKVLDSHGRNVAHVCCLFGSTRCLHWFLETYPTNINSVDKMGNNLAHSCCIAGQAECLNCCIQHDVPLNKLNRANESPLDCARKSGKSLHILKAVNNEIKCEDCVKNALKMKWEVEHEKSSAERTIDKRKTRFYDFNAIRENISNCGREVVPRAQSSTSSSSSNDTTLVRDLVAQYFGPEI